MCHIDLCSNGYRHVSILCPLESSPAGKRKYIAVNKEAFEIRGTLTCI